MTSICSSFRPASRGEGDESRQRLHAKGASAVSAHHDRDRGAVAHLRAISGSDCSVGVKGGLEPRERIERGIGARPFVDIEDFGGRLDASAAAVSIRDDCATYFDGHDFILEFSSRDCGKGLLVAAIGKLVGFFARDLMLAGQIFGSEAHTKIGVRIMIHQPGIRRSLIAAHGHHAHRFRAAGDNDFGVAEHDAFRRHGNGLQAGRTEAINGNGGTFHWQTGAQGGDARDIHALFGLGHSTT